VTPPATAEGHKHEDRHEDKHTENRERPQGEHDRKHRPEGENKERPQGEHNERPAGYQARKNHNNGEHNNGRVGDNKEGENKATGFYNLYAGRYRRARKHRAQENTDKSAAERNQEADRQGKYGKRTLLEATATTGATAANHEGHGPAGCDETSKCLLLPTRFLPQLVFCSRCQPSTTVVHLVSAVLILLLGQCWDSS
jgi:hypothetical protein